MTRKKSFEKFLSEVKSIFPIDTITDFDYSITIGLSYNHCASRPEMKKLIELLTIYDFSISIHKSHFKHYPEIFLRFNGHKKPQPKPRPKPPRKLPDDIPIIEMVGC